MNAFRRRTSVLGRQYRDEARPTPVKDFFKRQLTNIKPSEIKKRTKENIQTVKRAIILRNEETGEREISTKFKYPASQIVANWAIRFITPLTVFLLTQVTSWSGTAQAVIGGIGGDYISNVSVFAIAWLGFSIKRFKREGPKAYLKETGTIIVRGLVGLAIDLDKKLDERVKAGEHVSKLKRWSHRVFGAVLSPVPVVYYLYGAAITIGTKIGLSPVVASITGGFGLSATFMFYTSWINRKFFSEIDKKVQNKDQPNN
jgi:hypothetical protein